MTVPSIKLYKLTWLWLLFLVMMPLGQVSLAQQLIAVPTLNALVMDTASMMSESARSQLDQQLRQYYQDTGSQIVVLTVVTTAGESTFDYGARVMESWRLGRKGVDDGVLLLIARDDRRMQLLVGRGLEGAIPDVYARRILDDIVTPAFQKQDIDAGIVNAVAQIEKLIAGENLPASVTQQDSSNGIEALGMITTFVWMLSLLIRAIFGKTIAAILGAGMGFLASFWFGMGFFSGLVVALILFVLILSGFMPIGGGRGGSSGGGGFNGSSGGGFSGGGGSFGGGGASGRW